ncbi:hypothetical protein B0H13DRAFT_1873399 [Mycena leptocephala]|nr:hypothetical protein B0H13DRAFT_1873399 [Mycena leptocephala]
MKARLEGRAKNSQMEPLNSSSLRGGSETKPKTLTGFGIGIFFRRIFFGIFEGRFGFTARCRACTKMRADEMRRDEMKSRNRKPEATIDRGTYSPAYEGRNQKKQQRHTRELYNSESKLEGGIQNRSIANLEVYRLAGPKAFIYI